MGDQKDKRSGASRDTASDTRKDKDDPNRQPVPDVSEVGTDEPGHDVNQQTREDQQQHRGGRETGKDQHGAPKKGE